MKSWFKHAAVSQSLSPSTTTAPLRVLLFPLSLAIEVIAAVSSGVGDKMGNSVLAFVGTAFWALWFVIVFMMAMPFVDNLVHSHLTALKRTALVVLLILFLVGVTQILGMCLLNTHHVSVEGSAEKLFTGSIHGLNYNDGTALVHQASENLVEGVNPYGNANIVTAIMKFDTSYPSVTPLRRGALANAYPYPDSSQTEAILETAKSDPNGAVPQELESKLSYPAGSFLFSAPVVLLGLNDLRIFYLVSTIILIAFIVWKSPPKLRLLLTAAFLVHLELWNYIGAGGGDSLYILFLLLAWISSPRNVWFSAALMGMAVATKQIAWLFVPFYLILFVRRNDLKEALKVSCVIGVVFLAFNLPFIVSAPGTWFESVLAPVLDPMFPKGAGIVVLTVQGILRLTTPFFYSFMALAVLAIGLLWYYRHCLKYPQTGLVLAVMPLFFAWRSYSSYFFFAAIMVLGAVLIQECRSSQSKPSFAFRESAPPDSGMQPVSRRL